MKTAIGINGACGRMGQRLVQLAYEDHALTLAAALEAPGHPQQGRDVGEVAGLGPVGVKVGPAVPLEQRLDAVIDFSLPEGTMAVLPLCVERRIPLVVATTLGSALALFALVQTPGLSHFFGCTPLGPVAWTGVAVAIAVAAVAPWLAPTAGRTLSDLAARLRPTVRVTHA